MTENVRQTAPELTWGTLRVTCDNSPTDDGMGPQKAPEGTEDMKSIDNLREWWRDRFPVMDRQLGCDFREHIDAIEFEVKELADERDLLKRQWEAGVDFDQRLEACADKREDVTLWGVDYTPLPVDADGVPIRVGDVMNKGEVTCIRDCGKEWEVVLDNLYTYDATSLRHRAPTVEDVLREFAQEMNENLGMYTGEAIDADELREADERTIAEYAAKLRLKEG